MAILAVQQVSSAGLAPSFAAASAGGDVVPNDDRTILVVRNGHSSSQTVTIAKQRNVSPAGYGLIVTDDISVVVPPTTGEMWIRIPPGQYNASGQAQVTYSGVTSLTVAVVKRPQD